MVTTACLSTERSESSVVARLLLTLGVSEDSAVASDVFSVATSVTSLTFARAWVKRSTLWLTCSWLAESFATNASASAIAAATSILTEASWPSKFLALACAKTASSWDLSTETVVVTTASSLAFSVVATGFSDFSSVTTGAGATADGATSTAGAA